jgi:alpha-L-rhamnosidase
MNRKTIVFPFVILMLGCATGWAQFRVTHLKCEYLDNPIGIDESHPRLVWQLKSEQPGTLQKTFHLLVGTEESEVKSGTGNVWNSGIITCVVIPVVYRGAELQPFTRYYWSVRI